MSKLTLSDLSTLNNLSAVTTLNTNWDAIVAALENTLSRDGTSPNSMEADLDMNSHQILNLSAAIDPTEPVRLQEFQDLEDDFSDLSTMVSNALAAIQSAQNDLDSAVDAAEAAAAEIEALSLYVRLGIYAQGKPLTSEILIRYDFTDSVTFSTNLSPSIANAVTASTGTATFSVKKNGVEFGTITFTASSTGVFSGTPTTFAAGDILTLVAPSSQDATLADVSITLAANRVT